MKTKETTTCVDNSVWHLVTWHCRRPLTTTTLAEIAEQRAAITEYLQDAAWRSTTHEW